MLRSSSLNCSQTAVSFVESCWPPLRHALSAMPSALRDLIRALRLCSDRGHPGGQESGERSECHEPNRLGSLKRSRSPE